MRHIFLAAFSSVFFASLAACAEETPDADNVKPSCDFQNYIGMDVTVEGLEGFERPYRILEPDSMATTDYNPERVNFHVDKEGIVIDVRCG